MELSGTLRLIVIIAAAIVLAALAFTIISIVSTIVAWIIKIAVFVVIVYAVYLLARSTLSNRKADSKRA